MNLPEFLEHRWPALASADRYREMAKLLACHPYYVYQMATGRRFPSRKMLLRMDEISQGKITLRDIGDGLNYHPPSGQGPG